MPLVIHVQKKTIYSWVPRQPINPTHYFTKKLHPYDSPQICIRSSHCCQLITSHWTSVSDQQKEEMRRQRWGFPPKDFKVQQPPKKIGTGSIMFNSCFLHRKIPITSQDQNHIWYGSLFYTFTNTKRRVC